MSHHTPGEWVVIDLGEALSIRSARRRNVVATIRLGNEALTQTADARLIAAAPDLLAALQGVVKIADRRTVEFDRARAAIAKATGAA